MHIDIFYLNIHSISHLYHHNNTSLFAYCLNYIIEYLTIIDNIVIKFVYKQFGINCFFINEWIILFLYIIYTTVHNINYSIYKVNDYHTKHHDDSFTNIGPDIFDYLCLSKNQNTLPHECIDHYIPNIVGAFIIVYLIKNMFEENILSHLFFISYFILHFISIIACIYIYYNQIDDIINNEWYNNSIIHKEKIEFKF
jgi:hypothetical protein